MKEQDLKNILEPIFLSWNGEALCELAEDVEKAVASYQKHRDEERVKKMEGAKTVDATFPEVPMPSYKQRRMRTKEYNRGIDKAIATMTEEDKPDKPIGDGGTRSLGETVKTVEAMQRKVSKQV